MPSTTAKSENDIISTIVTAVINLSVVKIKIY